MRIPLSLVFLFMLYMNVGLTFTADNCFFGSTWDWPQYAKMLRRVHLSGPPSSPFIYTNDFENCALFAGKMTDSIAHSGNWSTVLDKDHETCCEHTAWVWDFNGSFPKFVSVSLAVKKTADAPVRSFLMFTILRNDSVIYSQMQPLDPFIRNASSWFMVFKTFRFPDGIPGDAALKVYVWNKDRNLFYADDLKIRYE